MVKPFMQCYGFFRAEVNSSNSLCNGPIRVLMVKSLRYVLVQKVVVGQPHGWVLGCVLQYDMIGIWV